MCIYRSTDSLVTEVLAYTMQVMVASRYECWRGRNKILPTALVSQLKTAEASIVCFVPDRRYTESPVYKVLSFVLHLSEGHV